MKKKIIRIGTKRKPKLTKKERFLTVNGSGLRLIYVR